MGLEHMAILAQPREELWKEPVAQGVGQGERHNVPTGYSTTEIVPYLMKRVYNVKGDVTKHVTGIGQFVRPALPVDKGDTKPIKDELKGMGGRWNSSLGGWIFSKSHEIEVAELIKKNR